MPRNAHIKQLPSYGLRPPEAAAALGSVELLKRARFHGWITPVVEQKRLTLFDGGDVAALWQRIRNGELPPPILRKTAAQEEAVKK